MSSSSTPPPGVRTERNKLLAFCKLFNFPEFEAYFTENVLEDPQSLFDDEVSNNNIVPNSTDLTNALIFTSKLRDYLQSKSELPIPSSVNSPAASDSSANRHWWEASGNLWPSLNPINYEELPNSDPKSKFAVDWRRVLCEENPIRFIDEDGQFSMAGYNFPEDKFPESFKKILNNPDASDDELQKCKLNDILLEVRRVIMDDLKRGYLNQVPEIAVNQICGTFTFIYKVAQENYSKMKYIGHKDFYCRPDKNTTEPKKLKNVCDIGKFLKLKFRYGKQGHSDTRKRNGDWVYTGKSGPVLAKKNQEKCQQRVSNSKQQRANSEELVATFQANKCLVDASNQTTSSIVLNSDCEGAEENEAFRLSLKISSDAAMFTNAESDVSVVVDTNEPTLDPQPTSNTNNKLEKEASSTEQQIVKVFSPEINTRNKRTTRQTRKATTVSNKDNKRLRKN